MSPESQYLIWSIEHTAWWRPDEWGYTTQLAEAGTYSRERAAEIVLKARGNECMIPLQSTFTRAVASQLDRRLITLPDTGGVAVR
jgi:inosine-uridine nucleoside N-ribohydrolase